MELMFVALAGVIIGLGGRYLLPRRHTHGSALIPALGAAFAVALWEALTWAGLAWDGGWIWWITLLATGAVVIGGDLLIGRLRTHKDSTLLETWTKAGAPERLRG